MRRFIGFYAVRHIFKFLVPIVLLLNRTSPMKPRFKIRLLVNMVFVAYLTFLIFLGDHFLANASLHAAYHLDWEITERGRNDSRGQEASSSAQIRTQFQPIKMKEKLIYSPLPSARFGLSRQYGASSFFPLLLSLFQ